MAAPAPTAAYKDALLALQAQQRARLSVLVQQTEAMLHSDWQRGMGAAASLYRPVLDEYAKALAALRIANDDPAARLSLDWLTSQNSALKSIEQSVRASALTYGNESVKTVEDAQLKAMNAGLQDAENLTQEALFPASQLGVNPAMLFNRPNPDAISQFVGRAGNGHPLGDLFANFSQEATSAARQAMLMGLATGANPVSMAQGISQALGISRSRAITIARTEVLGSYRQAAHETYRANSDVLQGWIWSAGGANPCAMCAGMDGTLHDLSEDLSDHPCGKCAPIPQTKSWDEILGPYGIDASGLDETDIGRSYTSISEKFDSYSPARQREIIGTQTGYEAYKRGELTLKDFIGVRPASDGFPSSYYQKSLKELQIPTRQATRLVQPSPEIMEKLRMGTLRYTDLGKITPDELMPAWAKRNDASRIVYQILRNGLPYDMTSHERGLLITNLAEMLKTDLPISERAAVERQLQALGGQVERLTLKSTKLAEVDQAAIRETDAAIKAATGRTGVPDVSPTAEYMKLVHANQKSDVAWFADMHGMSVKEYEDAVAAKIQAAVDADVVSIRYPQSSLEKILDDGYFKTVHASGRTEVGYIAQDPSLERVQMYIGMRAKYEEEAFGYPLDLAPELRPVSGYIAPLTEDDAAARGFGDARIILKDDVRARSTMTVSDSLQNDHVLPRPMNDVHYDVVPFAAGEERGFPRDMWASMIDPLSKGDLSDTPLAYMEAQIHGGLKSSDIAEVIFNDGHIPSEALQAKLADAGIPWRMESDAKAVANSTADAVATKTATATSRAATLSGARAEVREAIPAMTAEQLLSESARMQELIQGAESERAPVERLVERLGDNPAITTLAHELGFTAVEDGLSPEMQAIEHLQHLWNSVADIGGEPELQALRMAINEEFGFNATITGVRSDVMDEAKALYENAGEGLRALARATYDETQRWFKDEGIDGLTIFRGSDSAAARAGIAYNGAVNDTTLPARGVSSWAVSPEPAYMSAAHNNGAYSLLAMDRIPVSEVWSTAYSGFGVADESEVIVMGDARQVSALTWVSKGADAQEISYREAVQRLADSTLTNTSKAADTLSGARAEVRDAQRALRAAQDAVRADYSRNPQGLLSSALQNDGRVVSAQARLEAAHTRMQDLHAATRDTLHAREPLQGEAARLQTQRDALAAQRDVAQAKLDALSTRWESLVWQQTEFDPIDDTEEYNALEAKILKVESQQGAQIAKLSKLDQQVADIERQMAPPTTAPGMLANLKPEVPYGAKLEPIAGGINTYNPMLGGIGGKARVEALTEAYGENQLAAALDNLTMQNVRQAAREYGLSAAGSKEDIISRIVSHVTEGRYTGSAGRITREAEKITPRSSTPRIKPLNATGKMTYAEYKAVYEKALADFAYNVEHGGQTYGSRLVQLRAEHPQFNARYRKELKALGQTDTLAAQEGMSAAQRAALDDALNARIDRIPVDASVADIQDFIKTQLPNISVVELMSLDQTSARLVANAATNLMQQLPKVADNIWRIEADTHYAAESLALVPRDGLSLVLNTDRWANIADIAMRAPQYASDGWWVAQTPEEIIGHEIGHLFQLNYHITNNTWEGIMDRVAATGANPLVSTYAGNKIEESFAETFALLVYGEPTDEQLPILRALAQLLKDNDIDYNDLRVAVGSDSLDLGAS
jgi:hypothetical protein